MVCGAAIYYAEGCLAASLHVPPAPPRHLRLSARFQAGAGVVGAACAYSSQPQVREVSATAVPPPSETEKGSSNWRKKRMMPACSCSAALPASSPRGLMDQ